MKLPRRHAHAVFSLVMSTLMAWLVTGVLTWRIHGLAPEFLSHWLHAFLTAWPVILPAIYFLAPVVKRWTDRLTERE